MKMMNALLALGIMTSSIAYGVDCKTIGLQEVKAGLEIEQFVDTNDGPLAREVSVGELYDISQDLQSSGENKIPSDPTIFSDPTRGCKTDPVLLKDALDAFNKENSINRLAQPVLLKVKDLQHLNEGYIPSEPVR